MRGAALVVAAVVVAACGESAAVVDAAVADGEPLADASRRDGATPLTWIDFTVAGCDVLELEGTVCRGAAPLVLRFAPLAPAPVDRYLWELGDGAASTEVTPAHTYVASGAYTVTLSAGGPGGTAQVRKDMLVRVEPASVGASCSATAVCGDGLECICGGDPSCPISLQPGLCSRACVRDDACDGAVCVDLAPGDAASTAWRRPLCLSACDDDADCGSYRCRELVGAEGGWVRGCFAADLLLDDGAACRGGVGSLEGERCASGRCLDWGVRGLCAASCTEATDCPSYATCAAVSGGGSACLARCSERGCDGDPWLACEAPDPSGARGFTVAETPDPRGYCAPKRCSGPADCPGGACPDGFCAGS